MSLLGWVFLLAGLALWSGAHLLRRVRPDLRARMGDPTNPKDPSKGIMAVLILTSLVLMIYGYRWTPYVAVWWPPAWTIHLNNLLMLLGLFIFGAGAARVRLAQKIRHPQLIGFKTWAVAHLIVNGDLASIILFGGLLAWAVVEVIRINKAEGREWTRPVWAGGWREVSHAGITIALFAVVSYIHMWLGVYPYPT
ncbi:MAG: NnrU family protein [Pseudomonadota bacterium]